MFVQAASETQGQAVVLLVTEEGILPTTVPLAAWVPSSTNSSYRKTREREKVYMNQQISPHSAIILGLLCLRLFACHPTRTANKYLLLWWGFSKLCEAPKSIMFSNDVKSFVLASVIP